MGEWCQSLRLWLQLECVKGRRLVAESGCSDVPVQPVLYRKGLEGDLENQGGDSGSDGPANGQCRAQRPEAPA